MILTAPTMENEKDAKAYIEEFIQYGSNLNGTAALDEYLKDKSYGEWLAGVQESRTLTEKIPGRVNEATFFCMESGRMVGMVNIRFGLNAYLFHEGGHIGYSVRPAERGKGYGTEILRNALDFCRFIGLDRVLVTSGEDNLPSRRVIEKCGGVLEDIVVSERDGTKVCRYWIEKETEECMIN